MFCGVGRASSAYESFALISASYMITFFLFEIAAFLQNKSSFFLTYAAPFIRHIISGLGLAV